MLTYPKNKIFQLLLLLQEVIELFQQRWNFWNYSLAIWKPAFQACLPSRDGNRSPYFICKKHFQPKIVVANLGTAILHPPSFIMWNCSKLLALSNKEVPPQKTTHYLWQWFQREIQREVAHGSRTGISRASPKAPLWCWRLESACLGAGFIFL